MKTRAKTKPNYSDVPRDHEFFAETPRRMFAQFLHYHCSNPKVFELFIEYAHQLIESGRKSGSVRAIGERIRWEHWIQSNEPFMLNNNYIPLYARLLRYHFPRFEGFFELRRRPRRRLP